MSNTTSNVAEDMESFKTNLTNAIKLNDICFWFDVIKSTQTNDQQKNYIYTEAAKKIIDSKNTEMMRILFDHAFVDSFDDDSEMDKYKEKWIDSCRKSDNKQIKCMIEFYLPPEIQQE